MKDLLSASLVTPGTKPSSLTAYVNVLLREPSFACSTPSSMSSVNVMAPKFTELWSFTVTLPPAAGMGAPSSPVSVNR